MAVLNPDHLFDQADKLVIAPSVGAPRQVDLRRAISSAYYGLFHFTMATLADEFVGLTQRPSGRYALVYRSVDHRALRILCAEVQKQTPPRNYSPYIPANGFGQNIQAFATAAIELQEKRHRADYDPVPRFRTSDAKLAIGTALSAVRRFTRASPERRKAFLTLLLCPPR